MLDDAAVGQDRLDADYLSARHAMGDDTDAAGIRRHRAADSGRVASGEIDAVLPAVSRDVAMEVTEGDANRRMFWSGTPPSPSVNP